ncbi:MAG: ATP-binding protein, partial [Flavobacterium sp.]
MPDTPEQQNTEWKESWREDYFKWICGFANAQGGRLYIGKDDRGQVVGITNSRKLLEDLPNQVRDVLGILAEVNHHTEGERTYLEIVVEPYPYPISYRGRYYFRSGSTNQELKGPALDTFLLQKQGKRWDGVPVP